MDSTTTTSSTRTVNDDEDVSILYSISEALESWCDRICNLDTICKKTLDLHEKVKDSLERQMIDGLISRQDLKELEYTSDLWQKLYISFNCKILGCEFSSRDIITYLLELYSLNQISSDFFINVAMQLLR
jgi:hypothetical protein